MKSKSSVVAGNAAPGFIAFEPVCESGEKKIATIRVKNGFYHGQVSSDALTGLGSFFWDTGEFYFGEWVGGVQNVRVDDCRAKASCSLLLVLL